MQNHQKSVFCGGVGSKKVLNIKINNSILRTFATHNFTISRV